MGIINNFSPFIGQHCETNTSGNLLKHAGLELSEPMLFGIGEGLAFGVLNFKSMPAPFIGGRPKGEEITKKLSSNLGIKIEYRTTRSKSAHGKMFLLLLMSVNLSVSSWTCIF